MTHWTAGKRARWMLPAALLLLTSGMARAQIVAPAGRTLFNHGVMVRSFVRVQYFSTGVPGEGLRRVVNPTAVVWGAHTNLSLTFVAPLISVDRNSAGNPSQNFTRTGAGDARVLARYDFVLKDVPGGSTRLSPEIGVKLPTGGAFGTGSTDFIAGLVFSHVRDPHWWVADAEWTLTTTGDGGFREGNTFRYDLAYLFRVWPREGMGIPTVMLVAEFNGEHHRRTRLLGAPLTDTGGNQIFFSPGVEWIVNNRTIVELASPVPLWRDPNGLQPKPSASVIAGVRWLF